MSNMKKTVFLTHGIIGGITGVVLLLIPGRFLYWIGWAPIDPLLSRVLGAAFLGLTWGDIQVWRGVAGEKVDVLIQIHLVFTTLASIGILRHLILSTGWPFVVWFMFAVFVVYAICWLLLLRDK